MTSLLFLLVAARVCGEIAERQGQPAMIGEILAGIILGPAIFGWVQMTPALNTVSELGVFLLVMLAGMELNPVQLLEAIRGRKAAVALMGFLVPLACGIAVGWIFGLDNSRIVFLGLCVAITALPVAVRMLLDVGQLHSPLGRQIVSAAVANDVLALLILGVILDATGSTSGWLELLRTMSWTAAKVVLLMAAFTAVYRLIQYSTGRIPFSQRILSRVLTEVKGKETLFALTLLLVLLFAVLAENAGLHFVVGAFFGAMLINKEFLGADNFEQVQKTASGMTIGFLAPIFFATLGLEFQAVALKDIGLVAAILIAAFFGKIGGGYLGGRMAGFSSSDSRILGIGLNGRGVMELVIANIALQKGFIGPGLFSVLILMGTVTTLVTPALLKRALDSSPPR